MAETPYPLNATMEGFEDYALRFAPRAYRKGSAGVVATNTLGGIAYLAGYAGGWVPAGATTTAGEPSLTGLAVAERATTPKS
jgi:hypothetical protein